MNNRIIFGKLAKQAKAFVDERGGTDALSAEAKKLGDIVKAKGSISDKAKEAAASAQAFAKGKPGEQPGAETDPAAPAAPAPAASTPPPAPTGEPPAFED